LLALATLIVYGRIVLDLSQGLTPGQFDVKHYFVPMAFAYDFALARGEFPAWNPFSFCGTPFAANPQSIVFYPPHFIRHLLTFTVTPLNTYYGIVLSIAIQSIAAGAGAYCLARTNKLSHIASFAAALVFIFGLAFTRRVVAMQFASTLLWMPFIVIGIRRMLQQRSAAPRLFYATGCGLMLGLSMLSGFIHIHAYIGVMLLLYWIAFRVIDRGCTRPETSLTKTLLKDAASFAVLFAVALGISAPMWMPAAEFAGLTNRAGAATPQLLEYEQQTLPLRETMFGPLNEDSFEPEDSLGYRAAGLSVFLLAAAGLLGARKRAAFVHVAVLVGLFDCVLGAPFPIATLVERLSPFQMVVPSRAFAVAAIPLAIAAAFGIDAIGTALRNRMAEMMRVAGTAVAIAVLLAACTVPWRDLALHLTLVTALILLAAPLLKHHVLFARTALCTVLFAEAIVWNYRAIPILIDKTEFIHLNDHDQPVEADWQTNVRLADPRPNAHLIHAQFAMNGYDPLYLRETWNLMAPTYLVWNYDRFLRAQEAIIDNPRTYHLMKRNFWLTRQYAAGPLPPRDRPFPPTTTAFLKGEAELSLPQVALENVPATWTSSNAKRMPLEPVFNTDAANQATSRGAWEIAIPETGGKHQVLHVAYQASCAGTLTCWFLSDDAPYPVPVLSSRLTGDGEIERTIDIPVPDIPNATVRLVYQPKQPDCTFECRTAELVVDEADENDRIAIVSRTINSATVEVGPIDGPRLLVFMDAGYPGWTATVDGNPTAILRVHNAFKGVEVEAGTHTVTFEFHSKPIERGMIIATITLLLICGACVAKVRSSAVRRNHPQPTA
jgi:hypothetical protein